MPRVYVTRKARFNAAHRLDNPRRDADWNRETFGKCNSPNWHGHNYVLEVTVAGEPDPETGYVIDLGLLQALIEERILEPCDHANLNLDVDFLQGILPTTENLAAAFWRRLADALPSGELHAVRLYETEHNMAEYRGE